VAEELTPERLEIEKRELPGGGMRFIIKEAKGGKLRETIDCERRRPGIGKPAWQAESGGRKSTRERGRTDRRKQAA